MNSVINRPKLAGEPKLMHLNTSLVVSAGYYVLAEEFEAPSHQWQFKLSR